MTTLVALTESQASDILSLMRWGSTPLSFRLVCDCSEQHNVPRLGCKKPVHSYYNIAVELSTTIDKRPLESLGMPLRGWALSPCRKPWIQSSATHSPSMVAHTYNLSTQKAQQSDHKFKVTLGYIVQSLPGLYMRSCLKKKKQDKTKQKIAICRLVRWQGSWISPSVTIKYGDKHLGFLTKGLNHLFCALIILLTVSVNTVKVCIISLLHSTRYQNSYYGHYFGKHLKALLSGISTALRPS